MANQSNHSNYPADAIFEFCFEFCFQTFCCVVLFIAD